MFFVLVLTVVLVVLVPGEDWREDTVSGGTCTSVDKYRRVQVLVVIDSIFWCNLTVAWATYVLLITTVHTLLYLYCT
jgi:ABC-type siderophore export system fused ATPase/permease subunit